MTETSDEAANTPRKITQASVVSNAAWAIVTRWSLQLIGVVQLLILVRLLEQQDFGIIAMITLTYSSVSVLFELGVQTVIVQRPIFTAKDYDTAWTVRALQSMLIAVVVVATAPLTSRFFHEPRLMIPLVCLAPAVLCRGCENVGIMRFQRDLMLHKDAYFQLSKRLVGFVLTLSIALYQRNYWAMVLGNLGEAVFGVVLSHCLCTTRPHISFSGWKSIWSMSQWLLVRNVGAYMRDKLDQFVVGARLSTTDLGIYSLAATLSEMPTQHLVAPANSALLPAFSRLQGNIGELQHAFIRAIGVIAVIVVPATVGIYVTADAAIEVLIGKDWSAAVPVFQWLAVSSGLLAFRYTFSTLLTSLGRVRFLSFCVFLELAIFTLIAVVLLPTANMQQLAAIRMIGGAVMTGLVLWGTISQKITRLSSLTSVLWRPVSAAIIMASVVLGCGLLFSHHSIVSLVIEILVGIIAYTTSICLLWFASGRPKSAEHTLLAHLPPLRNYI